MIRHRLKQVFAVTSLILCSGTQPKAQTINEQLEFLYSPLNKSRIATGMLADRGLFAYSPIPFNGTLTDSSYTTPLMQRALYDGLYTSVVTSTVTLVSPKVFYENLDAAGTNGVVLSMLHYNMDRIKDNAIEAGLLSYKNKQLHDVPGSAIPYQPFTLFSVAPLTDEVWGTTVTFTLNSLLRMTNSTAPVSQLQIDPGDGAGYRTITFNTPITVTYPTAGQKVVRVALTPSGGQSLRSHFRLTVNSHPQPSPPSPYDYSDDAITFQPVNGVHSGGVAFIKYSTSNQYQVLKKPLIVAEGFDPSSVLPILVNNSISDFFDNVNIPLVGGSNFKDAILSEYDIVYLDYTNGVDDIFRNARLLEEVIERVNTEKANVPNAQPNVVLGVSMGGLVSKVALRRMEMEGKSHNTRLFISLDSPHKGANVPPAYQALAWHVNDYFSFLDPSLSKLLYAPAVKQMLIQYPDIKNSTFTSSNHDTFMSQYEAFSFPTTTRNIAVINGSNAGTSMFTPYSNLINVVKSIGKYKITINAYAMPNKSAKTIYEAEITRKVSGWFWSLRNINTIGVELKRFSSTTTHLPYDGAPGGQYSLSGLGGLSANLNEHLKYNIFTFIPTASALAVSSNNPLETMGNQNLIGTSKTPFATYFAQTANQSHTQFTPQNAKFILNELSSNNLCLPNSNMSLSGTDFICTTNASFAVNNLHAGAVTWNNSSNIALSYTSGNSATLTANGNGLGWVLATITSGCGIIALPQKQVMVGTPLLNITSLTNAVGGEGNWCSSHYGNTFAVETTDPSARYEARLLSLPNLSIVRTNAWATPDTDPFGYIPQGWYLFGLRATNGCGTSDWVETEVEYNDCNNTVNSEHFSLQVSPNPASEEIHVSIVDRSPEVRTLSKEEKVHYVLYSLNQAQAVKSWGYRNDQIQRRLNVSNLKTGCYILVVTKGRFRQSIQVLIK